MTNLNTDSALILWYPMNEGTSTIVNNRAPAGGFGGGLSGSWLAAADQYIGGGVSLVGASSNRVEAADNAALDTNHWTYSLWTYITTLPDLGALISKQEASDPYPGLDYRYFTGASATQIQAAMVVGGVGYSALSPAHTLNTWQHHAITYDGEALTVYLNGSAGTPNTSMSGNATGSSADLWVGGNPTAPVGRYVSGRFADFRFYNRALDSTEITRLYDMRLQPIRRLGLSQRRAA